MSLGLDAVIKEVDKKTTINPRCEKMVIINQKTKIIYNKAPLKLGNRYFRVANSNEKSNIARSPGIDERVHDRLREVYLDIRVRYEAYCEEGNEEKLVKELFDIKDDPDIVLEHYLRNWLRDYGKRFDRETLASLPKFKKELKIFLKDCAAEIGLTLIPDIIIDQEKKAESFHIPWQDLRVKLSDTNRELRLQFRLDTVMDPSGRHLFFSDQVQRNDLIARTQKHVVNYFNAYVKTFEYFYLKESELIPALKSQLQPMYTESGLNITSFSLRGEKKPLEHDFALAIEEEISFNVTRVGQESIRTSVHANSTKVEAVARIQVKYDFRRVSDFIREGLSADNIENRLGEIIQEQLGQQLEIAGIQELIKHDELNEHFKKRIQLRLDRVGLILDLCHLEIRFPNIKVSQNFHTEVSVAHKIHGRSEDVHIVFKVDLSLKNSDQYISAGFPDLDQWIQERLELVTRKKLFEFDYVKVVLDFNDQLKKEIKDTIEADASKIGYDTDLLTITPRLSPLTWTEPFSIPKETNHHEIDLPTALQSFSVKLGLHMRIQIKDLHDDRIKRLIRAERDIESVVLEEVRESLIPYFHALDPQRYYMGFDTEFQGFDLDPEPSEELSNRVELVQTDDEVAGKVSPAMQVKIFPPVKNDLRRIIKQVLSDKFGAQIESLSLMQINTKIATRLDKLIRERPHFSVEIDSLQGWHGHKFDITIKVLSVAPSGWQDFVTGSDFDMPQIEERIKRYLSNNASTISQKSLAIANRKDHLALEGIFHDLINECTLRQFGLIVDLVDFGRHKSQLETNRDHILLEEQLAEDKRLLAGIQTKQDDIEHGLELLRIERESDKVRFEELTEKVNQAIDNDDEVDEAVLKRIKEMKKKYPTGSSTEARQLLEAQIPSSDSDTDDEFLAFQNEPKRKLSRGAGSHLISDGNRSR